MIQSASAVRFALESAAAWPGAALDICGNQTPALGKGGLTIVEFAQEIRLKILRRDIIDTAPEIVD